MMVPNPNSLFWNNQMLILETDDGVSYYTRILNTDEDSIKIVHPVNGNREPMNEAPGKQVHIKIYNDQKEGYVFDTILMFENNDLCFRKPPSSSIEKVQRRQYFRVTASLNITLELEPEHTVDFYTYDISGGGVSFFSLHTDLFKLNEVVTGRLYLPKKTGRVEVQFRAKIVNIRKDVDSRPKIALEFVRIKENHRNEIIQYCIARQLEMRKVLGEHLSMRMK